MESIVEKLAVIDVDRLCAATFCMEGGCEEEEDDELLMDEDDWWFACLLALLPWPCFSSKPGNTKLGTQPLF